MIEIRWLNKSWNEWSEDSSCYKLKNERVLQYRVACNFDELSIGSPLYDGWEDVPEEFTSE